MFPLHTIPCRAVFVLCALCVPILLTRACVCIVVCPSHDTLVRCAECFSLSLSLTFPFSLSACTRNRLISEWAAQCKQMTEKESHCHTYTLSFSFTSIRIGMWYSQQHQKTLDCSIRLDKRLHECGWMTAHETKLDFCMALHEKYPHKSFRFIVFLIIYCNFIDIICINLEKYWLNQRIAIRYMEFIIVESF